MPPQAVMLPHVAQSTLAAAVLEAEVEVVAVLELLGVLELLLELLPHPATSKIDPTAAMLMAMVAFDARKVRPSHAAPGGPGGVRWHLG
jgi:hypothetical protein